MATGPLPADRARRVHGYLAALVPSGELDDAWHDVTDELRYWGDDDLVSALHVAHAVVGQRLRVTDEVATLVLVEELGIDDPTLVAAVLDRSVEEADGLVEAVRRILAREQVTTPVGRVATRDVRPVTEESAPAPPDRPDPDADPSPDPATSSTRSRRSRPAVRIGFDEPEALPDDHAADSPTLEPGPWLSPRTRVLVAWAIVIWVVIAVLVWLEG